MSRSHVAPPDAAPAPNIAPGREWKLLPSEDYDEPALPPAVPRVPDLTLPNLTRQLVAEQLYAANLAAGQDEATARANADARALQMVP